MRKIIFIVSRLLAVACAFAIADSAFAAETGTLKKIRDAGEINLGYRESSIPFSYLDDSGLHRRHEHDRARERT